MAIPAFNDSGKGGVILSETLNLTRLTTWIASILGLVTAVSAGVAEQAKPDDNAPPIDWAGFDAGQRLVIVVALIVAVAVVHSADLLARSLATSRAVTAGIFPLVTARSASRAISTNNAEDVNGLVIALRSSDGQMLFYNPNVSRAEWVSEEVITFRP